MYPGNRSLPWLVITRRSEVISWPSDSQPLFSLLFAKHFLFYFPKCFPDKKKNYFQGKFTNCKTFCAVLAYAIRGDQLTLRQSHVLSIVCQAFSSCGSLSRKIHKSEEKSCEVAHTWYLSRTPRTLSVENFFVMWRNCRCGDILYMEKF